MPDKVVIFDMDGVIIDSEPAYLEMNKRLFSDFAIDMDEENYKALVGLPSLPMWKMLKEKYKLKNDITDFMDMERRRMLEILDSEVISKPIDGVENLMQMLKGNHIRLSVASSSARDNINFVLKKLKLEHYFDYTVSGEDVAHGKPAPDIFLNVADNLNCDPENCFVIEDSKNGIIAANAAGMFSIGFTNNRMNSQNLCDADLILDNFNSDSRNAFIRFLNKNTDGKSR
jgi:HAD superfamily hydrolase (TIGR01509 family)